jgi:hypothetical protein
LTGQEPESRDIQVVWVGGYGLWVESLQGLLPMRESAHGLSPELTQRLDQWTERYEDAAIDMWSWPRQAQLQWRVDGYEIATDIQRELGIEWQVLYTGGASAAFRRECYPPEPPDSPSGYRFIPASEM